MPGSKDQATLHHNAGEEHWFRLPVEDVGGTLDTRHCLGGNSLGEVETFSLA